MGLGSTLKSALGLASAPKGNFSSGQSLNQQEDLYNRYNINSAFGSRNFTTDANGRTTLNINETPEQQAIRQAQQRIGLDTLNSPVMSGQDYENQTNSIRDATFFSAYNLLKPQFDTEDTNLQDYLSNSGIGIGNAAYNKAFSDLFRNRGNQLNQLSLQSLLAASQEQDRLVRLSEAQRAARLAEAGPTLNGLDYQFFGNVAGINAAQNIANQESASNAYKLSNFQDTQKRRSQATTEGIKAGGSIGTGLALA